MNRLRNSWRLFKSSWRVLALDKELLLFPVLSGLASILLFASFVAGMWGFGAIQSGPGGGGVNFDDPIGIVLGLSFYVLSYFVIIYFNAALVGAAHERLQGGDPTVASGLAAANRRLGAIFMYALIAATVGLILRLIQERGGWIGRIAGGLFGMAWSLITYLVVPVLVIEGLSAPQAIRRSTSLFRATWGEQVIGNVGFGLISSLFLLPAILVLGAIVTLVAATRGAGDALLLTLMFGFAGAILYALVVSVVISSVQGIYNAALYIHATGRVVRGFPVELIESAFVPKIS